MFCKNCGRKLDDGTKFCKYCGTCLVTEEQPVQQWNAQVNVSQPEPQYGGYQQSWQQDMPLQYDAQQPMAVRKNPANKILLILLIIFCCVTVGAIGFTLYARSVSDESYYGQELTK